MNEAIRQRFFDSVLCGYKRVAILLICTAVAQVSYAGSAMHNEHLVEAPINLQSKISLQRGAQIFANNCVGCHSARFMRYERVAQDLSIPKEVMVENFLVGDMTIGDVMRSAMAEEDAKKWFGAQPPDLSLTARMRGPNWLYSYLIGFYPDDTRPWGFNNHIFDKVGMPHVLEGMASRLGEEKFRIAMVDLTNFMVYMAEPVRMKRERIGPWVLLFILVFGAFAYALNNEYWKDIK